MSYQHVKGALYLAPGQVRALISGQAVSKIRQIEPYITPAYREATANGWATKLHVNWETCPWASEGDVFWIKEGWGLANTCPGGDSLLHKDWVQIGYKATSPHPNRQDISQPRARPKNQVVRLDAQFLAEMKAVRREDGFPQVVRWRPAPTMPRWASRLLVTVRRVYKAQLNDLSGDALAGICRVYEPRRHAGIAAYQVGKKFYPLATEAFAAQWQKRYGQAAWDAGDVWVAELNLTMGGASWVYEEEQTQPPTAVGECRLCAGTNGAMVTRFLGGEDVPFHIECFRAWKRGMRNER